MRRLIFSLLVSALVAACGSDEDPHVVGACTNWVDNQGNPIMGDCEAACMSPPQSTGMSCDTVEQLNCPSFEFDGTAGCCISDGTTIRFYECQ